MRAYHVYILRCRDGSYYTGVTSDITKRFKEHSAGKYTNSYTFSRRPVQLVYYNEFNDVTQAIHFEKQLKGWSRKKKEALMNGDWDKLKILAECNNETSHKRYVPDG